MPDCWMNEFTEAGFTPEVQPLIMKRNAMRLLGLDGAARVSPRLRRPRAEPDDASVAGPQDLRRLPPGQSVGISTLPMT
jgi:hypothetical protein